MEGWGQVGAGWAQAQTGPDSVAANAVRSGAPVAAAAAAARVVQATVAAVAAAHQGMPDYLAHSGGMDQVLLAGLVALVV